MPELQDKFIHLHVHSAYSLAEGAIHVKDLVKHCVKNSIPAMAITDSGNMFGAMEFSIEAKKAGLQPLLGAQLKLGDDMDEIVLIVQNEVGYWNICKLVSAAYMKSGDLEDPHLAWEHFTAEEGLTDGLICLTGGSKKGILATPLLHKQRDEAISRLERLKELFPDNRLYIELQRHGWKEEGRVEPDLLDLAYGYDVPIVATNDCYFKTRDMHQAHDALLCISEGRYITEDDRRKVTPEHYLKSQVEMIELFSDLPEAIENTVQIAKRCSWLLEPVGPLLPPFDCEGGRTETEELWAQAKDGLRWRLDNFVFHETELSKEEVEKEEKQYWDRLDFEMNIIEEMGFPGYFLIVSDFIKWSKEHDIPVGPGRGSGAGSVVAWALKITDLDPLEFNLLFERFLNPERVSMPDFDVDFCQSRREEVIKYTQDKYGHDRVAQIITFGKLQARAVVRDVGRVLQMPYGQVDRISKMIPSNPANPVTLQEALDQDPDLRLELKKEETTEKLIDIALKLEGLYRHASTHAAGVVIGDRPLDQLLPLYRDPRSDMPVTQFNMKFVEQTGLIKFDFLGLKTMTVIQTAVNLVEEHYGEKIDILSVPLDDEKSYKLLSSGNTTGVFQLESSGMKDVLKKLKPNRFEDIIALVSLYRPGPMDNIPRYIEIKEGREEPDYMHPVLQPILEETFGIMIYQEQVMQAAQLLGGYSLGGADILRRAMGKKIVEEMDRQRKIFSDGAAEHHGVAQEKADEIFEQINKFAGYGFNKSHAAAYALIAYWTAYLKANYPVAFMASSMTWDMGNTEKLAIFKQELDKMKIPLLIPSVNDSLPVFKVEGDSVRYALAALKGVGEQAMETLVAERDANGTYSTLNDFSKRLDTKSMNRKQFEMLAASGAFECLHPVRSQVHMAADMIMRYAQSLNEEKASGQVSLFGGDVAEECGMGMPELPNELEWDDLDKLKMEFDAVGFYLSAHPLDGKREQLERLGISNMAQIELQYGRTKTNSFEIAAVLLKKQEKMSPKTGNKYAFLQLSDPTGVFEGMMFSETLARTREHLNPGTALWVKADVDRRDDQMRYSITNIKPLDDVLEKRLKCVEVDVMHGRAVAELQQIIGQDQSGETPIRICFVIDGENNKSYAVKMQLPGRYNFGPEIRRKFQRQDGVLAIREL